MARVTTRALQSYFRGLQVQYNKNILYSAAATKPVARCSVAGVCKSYRNMSTHVGYVLLPVAQ